MNRVSLGVQSLDPGILHLLGREHTPEQALHSVEMPVSYTHLRTQGQKGQQVRLEQLTFIQVNHGKAEMGTILHRCEVSKCSVNAQIKGKTFGFATIKYYLCC